MSAKQDTNPNPPTNTQLFSVADDDNDVSTLNDVLNGPNAQDPHEGSEGEGQATLTGGTSVDLLPATALHQSAFSNPTANAVAAASSVPGIINGSATIAPGVTAIAVSDGALTPAQVGTIINAVAQAGSGIFAVSKLANDQLIQQDPWDPNYQQVFKPVAVPLPAIPAVPAGLPNNMTTTLQQDLAALQAAMANVTSYSNAVYVTQNRLFSAYNSGDLISFNLQANTINGYIATLATADAAEAKADTAVADDLSSLRVNETISPAGFAQFQSVLKTQGLAALSPAQQAILNATLPNPSDQQALLTQLEQIPPSTTGVSLVDSLQNDAAIAITQGESITIAPLPGANNFTIADQTTNTQTSSLGTPYSGPVQGLQYENILVTSDNINVTANIPNVFIHSGSGSDALDVSKVNGNNVLDGDTGSNFLTGGTGSDTFFVDDRAAHADIWSTMNNFHAGDSATIWGVSPADFLLNWVDGQGAAGFTGLTLHATAAGKPTASLTLVGFTQGDLSNGRLSVSSGTDPASGSAYMYVHANA